MKLILASKSPRRHQILKDAGLNFEIVTEETEENFEDFLQPNEVAEFLAEKKATAVFNLLQSSNNLDHEMVVLAADTIVVLNNQVIGKPKDAADAKRILTMLSNQSHEVITAVNLKSINKSISFHSITKVYFNALSSDQIEYYIKNYKPFDKAGAYAIQEWIGLVGISKIEGDLYNVIGLPINKVVKILNEFA